MASYQDSRASHGYGAELPPPGGQGQAQSDQPHVAPSSELSILNSDQAEEDYSELESDNDNVTEDIVELTVGLWGRKKQISANRRRSRQQKQQEDLTYNLSTFLTGWCSNGRDSGRLAEALAQPRVREALKKRGCDIVFESEPNPTLYDSLQLRREMRSLLKEPPFGEFDPMQHAVEGEGKKTVAEVCNTTWVKGVRTSA
jgi:hypothetical protein